MLTRWAAPRPIRGRIPGTWIRTPPARPKSSCRISAASALIGKHVMLHQLTGTGGFASHPRSESLGRLASRLKVMLGSNLADHQSIVGGASARYWELTRS